MSSTVEQEDSRDQDKVHVLSPLESVTAWFGSSSSSSSSASSSSWISSIPQDPVTVGLLSAAGASGLTVLAVVGYRRLWRRIRNADYVTSGMLDRKTWVRGVVTSVGDGDNFRLFHTPAFYSFPLKLRSIPAKVLKDDTIHIRIAGVDAPENAHFGNPAQPHAKESLDWLRQTLIGKKMKCQLLRKDQYSRIVAVPYILRPLLPSRALPPLMLREGMAVVYTSAGSEYGPWGLSKLQTIQDEAKRKRKGLWALNEFEHPGDYKKRIKAEKEGAVESGAGPTNAGRPRGVWGWIRRMVWS